MPTFEVALRNLVTSPRALARLKALRQIREEWELFLKGDLARRAGWTRLAARRGIGVRFGDPSTGGSRNFRIMAPDSAHNYYRLWVNARAWRQSDSRLSP
jgi:hypothetical protein